MILLNRCYIIPVRTEVIKKSLLINKTGNICRNVCASAIVVTCKGIVHSAKNVEALCKERKSESESVVCVSTVTLVPDLKGFLSCTTQDVILKISIISGDVQACF